MNKFRQESFPRGKSKKDSIQEGLEDLESISEKKNELIIALGRIINEPNADNDGLLYHEDEELYCKFENIISELRHLTIEAITNGEFAEVIDIGRQVLKEIGVKESEDISTESPDDAIAVAEAINLSAKVISPAYYDLKPSMIVAASEIGASFGIGEDDAYYLSSPTIGTASFHDSYDEVGNIIVNLLGKEIPKWDHPWSGVERQDDAFNIIADLNNGRTLAEQYANTTSPQKVKEARDKYMNSRRKSAVVKMGDFLKSA